MKIVYIAHPIGGELFEQNLIELINIVRYINLTEEYVVPFVPYFIDLHALKDNIGYERNKGIVNNRVLFESGIIKELWLYGSHISKGIEEEIKWAKELGIKIVSKSIAMKGLINYTNKVDTIVLDTILENVKERKTTIPQAKQQIINLFGVDTHFNYEQTKRVSKMLKNLSKETWVQAAGNDIGYKDWWDKRNRMDQNDL